MTNTFSFSFFYPSLLRKSSIEPILEEAEGGWCRFKTWVASCYHSPVGWLSLGNGYNHTVYNWCQKNPEFVKNQQTNPFGMRRPRIGEWQLLGSIFSRSPMTHGMSGFSSVLSMVGEACGSLSGDNVATSLAVMGGYNPWEVGELAKEVLGGFATPRRRKRCTGVV